MIESDYATALGVKTPYKIIHGPPPENAGSLGYCTYDHGKKTFLIYPVGENVTGTVLHELGHIRAHESGFPIFSRTFRHSRSELEGRILDFSNGALSDFFSHPLVYSLISRFKTQGDWYEDLQRPLEILFAQSIAHYSSQDMKGIEREASFAVAHMAIQTAEILLSSRRHLPGNVSTVEECMRRLDDLSKKGLRLKDGFWEKAGETLEPYYSRNPDSYTHHMDADVQSIAELILPEDVGVRLSRGLKPYLPEMACPAPGVEIPNLVIDYYPK